MATFLELKSEISDQLDRDDLTDQIENAMYRAIDYYQLDRFYFSEERIKTNFQLDDSPIDFLAVPTDYVRAVSFVVVDQGQNTVLEKKTDAFIHERAWIGAVGLPAYYSIFDQQFRVFPIPDKEYEVNLHYYKQVAEPYHDDEETVWTSEVMAQLISYRTKKDIYINYLHDKDSSAAMHAFEQEVYDAVKRHSLLYYESGSIEPSMC